MNKFLMTLVAGTVFSGLAHAQAINYGALESIFGEPVTTSATGKPQRASEAPVAMKIISAEEIRRSGAKDIPQLLQHVSGVQVNRGSIGRADVSIRGYNQPYSNRILVLINGRQALVDSFGYTPWGQLPVQLSEIRQIEVVKGPNSSLFGFNAEQGVINIITFSPLQDDIDVATARVGTQEHREANVVDTMKINDDMAVRISAGYKGSDGFDRDFANGTGTSSSNFDDRRNVNVDHEWQTSENTQLRTQLSYVNGKSSGTLPFGSSGKAAGHNTNTGIQLGYKIASDYGLWDITGYRNSYDSQGGGSYENDLNVLKIENLFKVGADHSFRLGTEYRYNSITGVMFGDGNSKFDYNLIAPSAMWDWKVSDKLSLTNSVRYDHVDFGRDETPTIGAFTGDHDVFARKVEEISFNSGALYKFSETDRGRFSVARGLHIPSLIELGASGDLSPIPAGFAGNPNLQTERNLTVELGYAKDLPNYNASIGANIFWSKIENVVGPDIIIGGSPAVLFSFDEAGDSQMFGIELEAEGKYNNWLRWGANYAYSSVRDEDNGNNLLFTKTLQPKHQASIYGGFDFCNKFELDADLNYVSKTNQYSESLAAADQVSFEEVDGYFVLNTRVGYNWTDSTTVSLDGYNLIDKHREWAYVPGATASGGGHTLGRTVLVSLNHSF